MILFNHLHLWNSHPCWAAIHGGKCLYRVDVSRLGTPNHLRHRWKIRGARGRRCGTGWGWGGLQIGQNCGLPILVSKYLHRNMSESGMIDPSTSKSTSISWYFSGVWLKFQLGSSCLKICFFNLARPSIASTRCGSTKMVCGKLFEPVGCKKRLVVFTWCCFLLNFLDDKTHLYTFVIL